LVGRGTGFFGSRAGRWAAEEVLLVRDNSINSRYRSTTGRALSREPCGSLSPHAVYGGVGLISVAPGMNRLYGYLPTRKIPDFPGGAPRAKTTHPHPTPHMSLIKNCQKCDFLRRRSDRLNGGMHVGGRIGMKSPGGIPPPPQGNPGGGVPPCAHPDIGSIQMPATLQISTGILPGRVNECTLWAPGSTDDP